MTTEPGPVAAPELFSGQWPDPCRGVYAGGCVAFGIGVYPALELSERAHSHLGAGPEKGWVCVRYANDVYDDDGNLTYWTIHELAHVLTGQGHTRKWWRLMRAWGVDEPEPVATAESYQTWR